MWQMFPPMGTQPLGFVSLQPFGAYPWQVYVPCSVGSWCHPGVHQVKATHTDVF